MTERAWAPEPPWDCLTVRGWPVPSCQNLLKVVLNWEYSSRVGSYETFRMSTGWREVATGTAGARAVKVVLADVGAAGRAVAALVAGVLGGLLLLAGAGGDAGAAHAV